MSVEEAIDVLDGETQVDCIVSDHDLPDTDSVTFLHAVRAQAPDTPVHSVHERGERSDYSERSCVENCGLSTVWRSPNEWTQ